jgi:hypothetical protein
MNIDSIRWFTVWAFALLAALGSLGAVVLLRPAHLYRQKSHEGLAFAWVAVLLAASWCSAVLAAGLFAREAFIATGRTRRRLAFASGSILLLVLVSTIAGVWVERQGDRCIGGC